MRTEDGHIIDKCLNGDSAAFGLLVDKYKESIYALAYSKLHNFHDAEDITQEVFIKAYQRLRMLKRWESFLAWLYAITSNLCRNWIRAKSRRLDQSFSEDQESPIVDNHSLDSYRQDLTGGDMQETLNEAMNKLPEIHQQVLSLYYIAGMSNKEIARFLGTNVNTIEQRLRRARGRLKEEVLAMMRVDLAGKKLRAGFTLGIVELVKRMKIQPVPRMPWLPWGIPMASGVVITLVSIVLSLISFSPVSIGSAFPGSSLLDYSSETSGSDDTFYIPYVQKDGFMTYAEIPVELKPLTGNTVMKSSKDEGLETEDKAGSMAVAGNVPVNLQFKPLLGEEIVYKMTSEQKTELPGFGMMETRLGGEISRICIDIDDSGIMTVIALPHFDRPVIKLNDEANPEAAKKFEEYKASGFFDKMLVTDTFDIQKLKSDGTIVGDSLVINNMQGAINISDWQLACLPDKAVNIGQDWSTESNKYSLKGALLGFEEINGYRCAKIQSDIGSKDPNTHLTGETTSFLAMEEGFVVKSIAKVKYNMTNNSTTNTLYTYELSNRRKIPQEEFDKIKQEVMELNSCLALLGDGKVDEAKSALQKFLDTHPESYFKKGVEGSISQIDIMKNALEAVKKDSSNQSNQ